MYGSVPTTAKSLTDYENIIGSEQAQEIRELAETIRGARVLHINATAFGGGVAELLGTLVPLMNDVGLDADWQVIRGTDEFFNVTKAIHNSLQGMHIEWTKEMEEIWLRYNKMNADLFDEDYDFVVVHDPQPAGLLSILQNKCKIRPAGSWAWRCHIDLTDAQPEVWDFLRPYVEVYDAGIFTLQDYVKPDLSLPNIAILPPAIDPLSTKNMPLDNDVVEKILCKYGVDPSRPMVCQVSRFDPWKDPTGVIDAYRMVKKDIPDLQLVMVASMASDDPEGWSYYEKTARRAGEDYDIHLLSNLNGVGNLEVNAFQTAAKVVIQKSIREGFGLVVAEGLWKNRPVVGGKVGGIPLQVIEGKTGYLVSSIDECADRVLYLLKHPGLAAQMGRAGREHVRQNFLTTRYLRHYLMLFNKLAEDKKASGITRITNYRVENKAS